MADPSRNTPWRQGRFLPPGTSGALGFDSDLVAVATHDCDLTQPAETEPKIELIPAKHVERADGNLTHAKNPRRLHVTATAGGVEIALEFKAVDKRSVDKGALAAVEPADGPVFGPTSLNIFQRWLAMRYRRSAFPDEFESRLRNQTRLARDITKILKPLGDVIIAVYFDVDEGQDIERTDGSLYQLQIDLLYATGDDPEAAALIAEQAAADIERAFKKACFDSKAGTWVHIELEACSILADTTMTVAQAAVLKKYNLDHMSLAPDPPQPMAE